MNYLTNILYGGNDGIKKKLKNLKKINREYKKITPVKYIKTGSKVWKTGFSVGSFFSFEKLFFIIIVICTIAYLSLQIQKSKYEKKYVVALLILFVFTIFGGLFITKLRGPGPYGIFYILRFIFLGGTLITFLILNILLGQNKF
jgi:hypothetical protein